MFIQKEELTNTVFQLRHRLELESKKSRTLESQQDGCVQELAKLKSNLEQTRRDHEETRRYIENTRRDFEESTTPLYLLAVCLTAIL